MSGPGDDRILPEEVVDGTVPDADLATEEVGAKVEADEADLLEQRQPAVTEEDLEAEESAQGLDEEDDV
jgi:hypothetical protein